MRDSYLRLEKVEMEELQEQIRSAVSSVLDRRGLEGGVVVVIVNYASGGGAKNFDFSHASIGRRKRS